MSKNQYNKRTKEGDQQMVTLHPAKDKAQNLIEIDEIFKQRENETRNPKSGQELFDETMKLFNQLKNLGELKK